MICGMFGSWELQQIERGSMSSIFDLNSPIFAANIVEYCQIEEIKVNWQKYIIYFK